MNKSKGKKFWLPYPIYSDENEKSSLGGFEPPTFLLTINNRTRQSIAPQKLRSKECEIFDLSKNQRVRNSKSIHIISCRIQYLKYLTFSMLFSHYRIKRLNIKTIFKK